MNVTHNCTQIFYIIHCNSYTYNIQFGRFPDETSAWNWSSGSTQQIIRVINTSTLFPLNSNDDNKTYHQRYFEP